MQGQKKMVILGDMLELGDDSRKEHQQIVELLNELKLDEVCLVGQEFAGVAGNYKSFAKTDDCCQFLQTYPPKGYNILLKGSRGIQLEKIQDFIP
jgi:UDP-N-acetylmuramoyl-tripeptide--D-alanyl-D-alanine ligase